MGSQVRKYTRTRYGNFILGSVLILAGAFSLLPMYYALMTSFKPLDELMVFPPRFFVLRPTLRNYTELPVIISTLWVPFSRYLFNSIFVTVITTFLHVIVATLAAFVLAKTKLAGRKIIFLIIQFSLLFNVFTLAIPQYIIFARLGIINTYFVYILPFLPSALGAFLIKQYIEDSIPDTLVEAAKIDGANYPMIYWRIIMPMIKPGWLTLSLFTFRDVWAMPATGTIFSEELKMLPNVMSQILYGGIARTGNVMAATVVMMIPPIIVYLVSQSYIVETMSSAGIKD